MHSAVTTLPPPGPPSSSLPASAALLLLCLAAGAAADAPPAASASASAGADATHCSADERVQFSCRVGAKTVSLCAAGPSGSIEALSYRYGAIGRVEKAFTARSGLAQRFQGTVMPLAPRAQVRQVWFDSGDVRYLVSQCVGGDCPYAAGLAVLQGDTLRMRRRCEPAAPRGQSQFSRELVRFGSDVAGSQAGTPLLELGEYDNRLDQVYGPTGR